MLLWILRWRAYPVGPRCHHKCSYKRGRGRFPTHTEEEEAVWLGKQRLEGGIHKQRNAGSPRSWKRQ